MEGISLDARIRRKESLKALKNSAGEALPDFLGFGDKSHLPEAPEVPADTDQLQKFKDELLDIDRKKRQHLVIPKPTGSGFLKLSTVLIVLLFALSGVFFFAGGYLYSFNNPPAGTSIIASASTVSQEKPDWRLGTVVEGQVATREANVPDSYLARRNYIERNEVLVDKVYHDRDNRRNLLVQKEAKRIVNKTTGKITRAVRGVVGSTVSNIFNPLAKTAIKGTLGAAIDKAAPAEAGAPGTNPTGASASGAAPAAGGVASVPVAGGVASAPGEMGDLFALELQTFMDSTDAFVFVRDLKAKGYLAAYIVRVKSGRNMAYKVRIGNFANYADASEARKVIGYPSRVVMATRDDDPLKY